MTANQDTYDLQWTPISLVEEVANHIARPRAKKPVKAIEAILTTMTIPRLDAALYDCVFSSYKRGDDTYNGKSVLWVTARLCYDRMVAIIRAKRPKARPYSFATEAQIIRGNYESNVAADARLALYRQQLDAKNQSK